MKVLPLALWVMAACWLPSVNSFCQEPHPPGAPLGDPPPKLEARGEKLSKSDWSVRVDVQFVKLPQDLAQLFLPDLLSSDQPKVEAAVAQIQDLLKKKQAQLLAWLIASTIDRERVVEESIVEKRYASSFDPITPATANDVSAPTAKKALDKISIVPTAFETRNTGVTLEVEPTVAEEGHRVILEMVVQRTVLLGFDPYESVATSMGVAKIDQPQFASTKDTVTLSVVPGDHVLVGSHQLSDSKDQVELRIARVLVSKAR